MPHCKPPIKVALLMTGNEILSGDIVDTNSVFISKQLLKTGLSVERKLTIGDDLAEIITSLELLTKGYDAVIVNGGLGATVDDLTAEAVSKLTTRDLIEHPEAVKNIQDRYGHQFFEKNEKYYHHLRKQALVPEGATILPNPVGLAVGFKLKINKAVCYFTPGVPREMKRMVEDYIIPDLSDLFDLGEPIRGTYYKIIGLGESYIQNRIIQHFSDEVWRDIELGFRAALTQVEVKLLPRTPKGSDMLESVAEEMRSIFPNCLLEHDQALPRLLSILLKQFGHQICIVDGCTGGALVSSLEEMPEGADVLGLVSSSVDCMFQLVGLGSSAPEGGGERHLERNILLLKKLPQITGKSVTLMTELVGDAVQETSHCIRIYVGDSQEVVFREFWVKKDWESYRPFVCVLAMDMLRRYLLGLPQDALYYFDEISKGQL